MGKILKIIGVIVIFVVMQTPATQAQNGDSLYWSGDGDIIEPIMWDIIFTQIEFPFSLIHFKENSIIVSSKEFVMDSTTKEKKEMVVVLFYNPDSKKQRIIIYSYLLKGEYYILINNFIDHFCYCSENLIKDNWLNFSTHPDEVLCSKKLEEESLPELISKYPNLYKLIGNLSY